jgi:hypothetical protein
MSGEVGVTVIVNPLTALFHQAGPFLRQRVGGGVENGHARGRTGVIHRRASIDAVAPVATTIVDMRSAGAIKRHAGGF